ncbi:MAG: 50S ribosomal protein L11 methyltransferase [Deltaproteobacteria bacterium]|nr:MAG: 50S ribosomal protein L11 methyltransferase [Deltaproteobacteria bacterium]
MAEWVEIVVTVADDLAEDVAAAVAPNGAQLRDGEVVFWVEWDRQEAAVAAARAAVGAFGLAPSAVAARPAVPESEWRDAWKRYFRVERVTDRIVIVPSWERYEPSPGDVVLHLDPGMAFGTGSHASTQLCLAAVERIDPVDRFLDLGTGSGILAIAAAKLWPDATGVAVDIDPLAVDAARDNATRNGVGARVECALRPIDAIGERFPLILANIQAPVHLALRDPMVARLAPGGTLVLSGLLTEQVVEVADAFVAAGLRRVRVDRSERDPEWSSIELRAP